MSQFNSANYPTVTPAADDLLLIRQDSSGDVKTSTVQGLANVAASLASLNSTVTVISAQQTLSTEQMVVANAGGAFDIDLPASSLNTGRSYHLYNKGAGAVTFVPNGSDTIAGAADLTLAQNESAIIRSDGLGDWSAVVGA